MVQVGRARSGAPSKPTAARTILGLVTAVTLAFGPVTASWRQALPARAAGASGVLTMVTPGSAADIDPASDQLASSNLIQRNIYDELLAPRGASLGDFQASLATSWSSNAAKSVWTIHLRHGVTFHTGREMTATDVKYSLARTIKAGLAGSYLYSRFISKPDTQIKVVDPYTVEFDLGSSQPLFINSLDNEYVGAIVDSTEVKKHATKGDPYGHAWLSQNDAGTGPYTLKSWQRSQQVTLVRFPGYWAGWSGRHFSTIVIKTVPENTTRRELLERGDADLTFALTPQDNDALKGERGVTVTTQFTTELQYLFMTEAGPLASPLARQALSYAFPYDAYIRAAYRGSYARRAYGPIPSVLLGYDPHMFHYQTDLNKAKALLQQAGVKPGTVLTFDYASSDYEYQIVANLLVAQLGQLGITVKPQGLDEAAYNGIYYKTEPASQHPNLLTFSWWPDFNDPYDMAIPLIYSRSAGSAGANAGYYHNATVDKLLDASANADKATLIHTFKSIQDITGRQDPPAIWLSEPAQVTVTRSDVKGLSFNPLEVQTYNFYTLYR